LQKQDGEMASLADDDISEIEQYHWQTDVFNNMKIVEVHKKMISSTILVYSEKIICIINAITQKLRLLLIYLQAQQEHQDDQPTMGENDLRIIAAESTSTDITSAVTDDNEHVNGSQDLQKKRLKNSSEVSRLLHLNATMHQSIACTQNNAKPSETLDNNTPLDLQLAVPSQTLGK
jgi:hypothetical protein